MKISLILTLIFFALTFSTCGKLSENSTPTATFKAYIEAANKNDTAALKQYFSQGTLKMLDEAAKAQNTTLDEVIKNQINLSGEKKMPETRNETIEGANATLEIKNNITGTWDKVYFKQEDGSWKIALDKFMEEMMKEATQTK
jgi:hypothetical protein